MEGAPAPHLHARARRERDAAAGRERTEEAPARAAASWPLPMKGACLHGRRRCAAQSREGDDRRRRRGTHPPGGVLDGRSGGVDDADAMDVRASGRRGERQMGNAVLGSCRRRPTPGDGLLAAHFQWLKIVRASTSPVKTAGAAPDDCFAPCGLSLTGSSYPCPVLFFSPHDTRAQCGGLHVMHVCRIPTAASSHDVTDNTVHACTAVDIAAQRSRRGGGGRRSISPPIWEDDGVDAHDARGRCASHRSEAQPGWTHSVRATVGWFIGVEAG